MEPINAPNNLFALLSPGPDLSPPVYDASFAASAAPNAPVFADNQTPEINASSAIQWASWQHRDQPEERAGHGDPPAADPRLAIGKPHDNTLGSDLQQQLFNQFLPVPYVSPGPVRPTPLADNTGGGGGGQASPNAVSPPATGGTPAAFGQPSAADAKLLWQLASLSGASASQGNSQPHTASAHSANSTPTVDPSVIGSGSSTDSLAVTSNSTATSFDSLMFLQPPPAQITAGLVIQPAIKLEIVDSSGNVDTANTHQIYLSLLGSFNSLGGTTTVTPVNGVVTFSDVYATVAVGPVTFLASDASNLYPPVNSAFSNPVAVVQAATTTAVTSTPNPSTVGGPITFTVTVTPVVPPGGVFENSLLGGLVGLSNGNTGIGSAQLNSNGVATYTTTPLQFTTAGSYTIEAVYNTTPNFTGSSATMTQVVNPTNTNTPPTLVNPGNQLNLEGDSVSLQLQGSDSDGDSLSYSETGLPAGLNIDPSTGLISGTITASPASFHAIATVMDSAGLSASQSFTWTVTAAAADHLAFLQQPTNTVAGQLITPPVTVAVEDRFNNVVTTDNSTVSLALNNNGNNAVLNGTLAVAASGGMATFSDLSVNQAGTGYTLQASDGNLTGANSSSFNVGTNSSALVTFTQFIYQVGESNPSITVYVQRGEGQAGQTYISESGTVTFAPGESIEPITIPLAEPVALSEARSFLVEMTNPTNLTIAEPGAAIVQVSGTGEDDSILNQGNQNEEPLYDPIVTAAMPALALLPGGLAPAAAAPVQAATDGLFIGGKKVDANSPNFLGIKKVLTTPTDKVPNEARIRQEIFTKMVGMVGEQFRFPTLDLKQAKALGGFGQRPRA